MRLEALSRYHAIDAIEKELGSASGETATKFGAISEHIRAALYLESRRLGQGEMVPVSTTTITRIVKQRLSPIWPCLVYDEQASDLVLQSVYRLAELGELVKVDSMHWIPAPARTVRVDEETRILVDSTPLSILPLRLRRATQIVGSARLVDTSKVNPAALPPLQGLVEWLRCPHAQVHVWSKAFTQQTAKKLLPVETLEGVDIFADGRWRQPKALHEKYWAGVQLYRRALSIYGNHASEYGLCRLQANGDGQLEVVSAVAIEKHDAQRLRGSMRLTDGRAQAVTFHRVADLAILHLPRSLPTPENVFLNLGWPSADHASVDWPAQIAFSRRLVPLLRSAFELLGYMLVEHVTGDADNGK